jgi:S1-C subfamily serine protease
LLAAICGAGPAPAANTWEAVDKRVKQQVCKLNVGLKLQLYDGRWLYLSDLSPKLHLPVFSASSADKGFRVVSTGSAFPVQGAKDETWLLTSKHVIESADDLTKECERFFAAMRYQAEQNARGGDVDRAFGKLLDVVNLSIKPGLTQEERAEYATTVDAIWDTYEAQLSLQADPERQKFLKYARMAVVKHLVRTFVHRPGAATQQALEAKLIKAGQAQTDLALLSLKGVHVSPMELDAKPAAEGEEIQIVGYPVAAEQIETAKIYTPTFTTGRVSRVTPSMVQVDATVQKGDSGGPLINSLGKVLGVVAVKAPPEASGAAVKLGGAVPVATIRTFAPELFEPAVEHRAPARHR